MHPPMKTLILTFFKNYFKCRTLEIPPEKNINPKTVTICVTEIKFVQLFHKVMKTTHTNIANNRI